MQNNPNTDETDDTEDTDDLTPKPAVERDQWEIAFEPLEGDYAAIRMGFNIAVLKSISTLNCSSPDLLWTHWIWRWKCCSR